VAAELMQEPPDGAYVLLGEPDEQELYVRDDSAAREAGYDGEHWFLAGSPLDDPITWDALTTEPFTRELPPDAQALATVARLYTQAELDRAVADGGYEDIGEHRIGLGAGRCVVHGEVYEPLELDRLREREGGGSGG
jgi:hypothetical protein